MQKHDFARKSLWIDRLFYIQEKLIKYFLRDRIVKNHNDLTIYDFFLGFTSEKIIP